MSGRRVLVIDDDEGIRVTIEAALADCEVTSVGSALEALPLLGDGAFDVVVCDLMMPGMTGPELYESLGVDSPYRERFIFITGGNVSISLHSFVRLVKQPVLDKPFSIRALRESVAAVLDVGLASLPSRE